MGLEIERKFLVADDAWRVGATGQPLRQGYLSLDPARTVRVRLAGERAWLTIKGLATGPARQEFEYPIPADDARALLDLCAASLVQKTRYRVAHAGRTWDVDVFAGDNAGLVLAEVELADAHDTVVLPPWVAAEVTGDHRYANASLAARPFTRW